MLDRNYELDDSGVRDNITVAKGWKEMEENRNGRVGCWREASYGNSYLLDECNSRSCYFTPSIETISDRKALQSTMRWKDTSTDLAAMFPGRYSVVLPTLRRKK
ncbi:hypothetical protein EVAR_87009_1 [Eumeta japonica]|uniref:Uncharacterized protein n=1 Tax=Eumeta variegata TaxID=151549 RepID=A0A4C1W9E6_EUMVA|nr:hypothetical protein EVAR_87009_1 [Eumeta japonica]